MIVLMAFFAEAGDRSTSSGGREFQRRWRQLNLNDEKTNGRRKVVYAHNTYATLPSAFWLYCKMLKEQEKRKLVYVFFYM